MANVQIAIAGQNHPSVAASGIIPKEDRSTSRSRTVTDQGAIASI